MKIVQIFGGIVFLIGSMTLSGQTGPVVIEDLAGRVQVKAQDSSEWQTASIGQSISPGAVISTGFKSTARLNTGSAAIDVQQLTRLTIEELITKDDSVKTSLFLNGGRINTEVSREKVRQDFTVRSTVATASVRGTGFSFDGIRLYVRHGAVLMESGGRSVMAYRGDRIKTAAGDKPGSRVKSMNEQSTVTATLILDEDEFDSVIEDMEEDWDITVDDYIPDASDVTNLIITLE